MFSFDVFLETFFGQGGLRPPKSEGVRTPAIFTSRSISNPYSAWTATKRLLNKMLQVINLTDFIHTILTKGLCNNYREGGLENQRERVGGGGEEGEMTTKQRGARSNLRSSPLSPTEPTRGKRA